MLKDKRQKTKSKSLLVDDFFASKNNFKNTSIGISLHSVFCESLGRISDLSGLPLKNEHKRIVTRKAINSFDFIQAILAKEKINELYIAFYRIGKKTATQLKEIQEKGHVDNITFLINDGFPKLVPDAYNLIKGYESENWKVKLENNHTKIILAKTKNNFYIVEGSGNLSINARIEQYCFDNNEEIYNFHKTWIDKI